QVKTQFTWWKASLWDEYFDTYAPVVTWFAIRIIITISILFELTLQQIDFVQAYPQAPIKTDMYMELPKGIKTCHGNSKDHVLMLLSNLYGQKQVGHVWNSFLVEKLLSLGFQQSFIDECVFYCDDVIFIVYVDDGIFLGPDDRKLTNVIKEMKKTGLDIEDQGRPADYQSILQIHSRALIDSIVNDVNIGDAYTKPAPANASMQLHAFKVSPKFSECKFNFNYHSVARKLNYLGQTTRGNILFATHQIAKYSSDPMKEHGEAIIYLVRYLKNKRHLGLKFHPDCSEGFEYYCDADFLGNWNRDHAQIDPSTEYQVALSTTEAEYIAMSMALRDAIPVMELLDEMKRRNFQVLCKHLVVYCKVFEDNSGALELACLPKLCP
ncbi:hypothetical protein ACHAW6_000616, partial [Cyclotella cf. meneghiniana]